MEINYETIRNMEVRIETLEQTIIQLVEELRQNKVISSPKK
jgi:hypothetical protein